MKVLFVCLGNICRSPAAEGVFRREFPKVDCDSAGTGDWHVGEPPYGPMQTAARARGVDLATLRARQFVARDFADFDLIVCMDDSNMLNVLRFRPAAGGARVVKLTDYLVDPDIGEVPDPYYTRDFDGALDLIERAVAAMNGALKEI